VCDPAQADFVTECGSTWPKMAFVSHPRLVTTAQPGLGAHHVRLCLQFRVYREGASSCTVQAAFVNRHHGPPDAVTPPPHHALNCRRPSTQNSHSAHCIPSPSTAAGPVIWSGGAPLQGRWG